MMVHTAAKGGSQAFVAQWLVSFSALARFLL